MSGENYGEKPGSRVSLLSQGFALLLLLIVALALGLPASSAPLAPPPNLTPTPTPPACVPAWRVVDSPNPDPAHDAIFGMAAISANDVWAVGDYGTRTGLNRALTLHWDGTSWTNVPCPVPGSGTTYHTLNAVSAVSSNDVWAVGGIGESLDANPSTGKYNHSLIMHWDGTQWTRLSSSSSANWDEFTGVSAVSANDVWAVGEAIRGYNNSLVVHWDGTSWTEHSAPTVLYAGLDDVAALSPTAVWTIGSRTIYRWDGSSWSTAASAPGDLHTIRALSANDIWAGGNVGEATLLMHWDGAMWSVVPSPNRHGANRITAIAPIAANNVWALGQDDDGPLVLHWDGFIWTIEPQSAFEPTHQLFAAAAVSGEAWAGGVVGTIYQGTTLLAHYSGPCLTPTTTPTHTATPTSRPRTPTNTPSPVTSTATPTLYPCGVMTGTVVSSANVVITGTAIMRDVAVVSHDDVWSVGYATVPSLDIPANYTEALIQHWDGTRWNVVSGPSVGGASGSALYGVTAVSANDVWAVGAAGGQNLIEHWNGTEWSVSYTSNTAGSLVAVDALSATDIWAVSDGMLTMHYNGATWSELPAPPGVSGNLADVEAISANDVWAVGGTNNQTLTQTLTIHWNGTQWTRVPSPNPVPYSSGLTGVAAAGPNDVWAIAYSAGLDYGTLVLHWDGAQWNTVDDLNARGLARMRLLGIGTTPSHDIWIGAAYYECEEGCPDAFTLAHRVNGVWQRSRDLLSSLVSREAFAGASTNDTWVVSSSDLDNNNWSAHWDGSHWTRINFAPVYDNTTSQLRGVSTLSDDDVWAVGNSYTGDSLTEHWDGSEWNIITATRRVSSTNILNSVAAISTNDVWAVGNSTADYASTLIEHWDGAQWNLIDSPNVLTNSNYLQDVAARAPDDVWAVGYYVAPPYNVNQPLILHYDGATWSHIPSPAIGLEAALLGVSAIAPEDAWAVGYYKQYSAAPEQTLIMHWDGNYWSQVPSPNIGSGFNKLWSVSAAASNDVWAVGYARPSGVGQPLTMHWDGTQWDTVGSPNPGGNSYLFDVKALSVNDAVVVGHYLDGGVARSLAMQWDGRQWSVVGSANANGQPNYLYSVDAVSPYELWSIGNFQSGPVIQTLAERFDTSSPFSDVHPTDYFHDAVLYMACHNIISGYADGTFRPYNNTTRGQLCKIVVLAERWTLDCPFPGHFTDVPPENPFYCFIEAAYQHGIISGYADGTFRPYNNVTRGQLCKIVVLARSWQLLCPQSGHFSDVPPDSPFYCYIETAYDHGIISGYADGTFRPGNNSIRGQISKIVYLAVTAPPPPTSTPTITPTPTATGTPILCPPEFQDVPPSHPDHDYIHCVSCQGSMDNFPCGGQGEPCVPPNNYPYFRPDNSYIGTRGEICKLIVIAADLPIDTSGGPNFTDIPVCHTLYPYIETAYSRGLIGRYSDGTFRPNNIMARGQFARVIVLAADWTLDCPATPTFVDVDLGHPYYCYIETAYSHGAMWGYPDGTFRPDNGLNTNTRAEVAHMTARSFTSCGLRPTPTGTPPTQVATCIPTFTSTPTQTPTYTRTNIPTITGTRPTFTCTPTTTPTITQPPTITDTPTLTPTLTPLGTPALCPPEFQDVSTNHPDYANIHCVACQGSMDNFPCGQPGEPCVPPNNYPYFRPNNAYIGTRGEICRLLVIAGNFPIDTSGGPHFTDVPVDHLLYPYIETAYNSDMISGYSDDTFRPGNIISRGEFAKALVLAAGWEVLCPAQPSFSDVPPYNPYYCYIETAYGHTVMWGYPDGTFRPDNGLNTNTRAEIARTTARTFTACGPFPTPTGTPPTPLATCIPTLSPTPTGVAQP